MNGDDLTGAAGGTLGPTRPDEGAGLDIRGINIETGEEQPIEFKLSDDPSTTSVLQFPEGFDKAENWRDGDCFVMRKIANRTFRLLRVVQSVTAAQARDVRGESESGRNHE